MTNDPAIPAPPAGFKDRSTGLLVFGVLTVLLGALVALFIPVMILGRAMSARLPAPSGVQPNLLPAVLLYSLGCAALVWLGIGSILKRRWARALLLIGSWMVLILGVAGIAVAAFVFPRVLANIPSTNGQDISPAMITGILLAALIPAGFLFVVVPAVWILFYGGRDVRATCEARDPLLRWTDRCPLPVLAFSLWLGFSAISMLLSMGSSRSFLPLFGSFVTGIPSVAGYVVITAIVAYCAYETYRLGNRGWWISFAGIVAAATSTATTYLRHDAADLFRLLGTPEDQIGLVVKMGIFQTEWMVIGIVVFSGALLGYLVYLRKYFVTEPIREGFEQENREDRETADSE